ncbi:uncharacterized protein EAF02_007324 [Botrytis sinoallii]|uniref:uncharacterized protein n=1 Tax=Botrytis sinoallii TaxID=1463999 RepID=UPI001901FBBE|nr:uncharacterized protein EAF02_007324 [Botrytis sinoallii]KAF7880478.1 hypothetical protein EAF02_007324 [Botrytis sinoallii]
MHFYVSLITILSMLPELPRAICLSSSSCASPTGKASSNISTHSVIVGAAGRLAFNPTSLDVALGDKILFEFLALNHTLTQSSLRYPCTWNASGGIDTGFKQFNPSNDSGKFIVKYTVEDTTPLWFFCSQRRPISHCHEGMIFALNPGSSFGTFLQGATGASISMLASNTRMTDYPTGSAVSNTVRLTKSKCPSNSYTQSGGSQTTPTSNGPSKSYTQSLKIQATTTLKASASTDIAIQGSATPSSSGGYKNGGIELILFSFVLAVANF